MDRCRRGYSFVIANLSDIAATAEAIRHSRRHDAGA
jgi:hypothetical protein